MITNKSLNYAIPAVICCAWVMYSALHRSAAQKINSSRSMEAPSTTRTNSAFSKRLNSHLPDYTELKRKLEAKGGDLTSEMREILSNYESLINSYRANPDNFFQALLKATKSNESEAEKIVEYLSTYCDLPQMAFDWTVRHSSKNRELFSAAFRADPSAFVSEILPRWNDKTIARDFVWATRPRSAPPPEMLQMDPANSGQPLNDGLSRLSKNGTLPIRALSMLSADILKDLTPQVKKEIGEEIASHLGQTADSTDLKIASRFYGVMTRDDLLDIISKSEENGNLPNKQVILSALASGNLPLSNVKLEELEISNSQFSEIIQSIPTFDVDQALAWTQVAEKTPELMQSVMTSLVAKTTDPLGTYAALSNSENGAEIAAIYAEGLIKYNPAVASYVIRDALNSGSFVSDSVLFNLAQSQIGVDNEAAKAWALQIKGEGQKNSILQSLQ